MSHQGRRGGGTAEGVTIPYRSPNGFLASWRVFAPGPGRPGSDLL